MLKPAFLVEHELNKRYQLFLYHPKMKYLVEDVWDFTIPVDSSNDKYLQFVSVDPSGTIQGFFSAEVNRKLYHITNLEVIHLVHDKDIRSNTVFSRDFASFIKNLTGQFGFRKVNFEAIVGSPGEKIYDKHLKTFNARVVGIRKNEVRLSDGKFYDVKMYELYPQGETYSSIIERVAPIYDEPK
jgi:hypothetical protein